MNGFAKSKKVPPVKQYVVNAVDFSGVTFANPEILRRTQDLAGIHPNDTITNVDSVMKGSINRLQSSDLYRSVGLDTSFDLGRITFIFHLENKGADAITSIPPVSQLTVTPPDDGDHSMRFLGPLIFILFAGLLFLIFIGIGKAVKFSSDSIFRISQSDAVVGMKFDAAFKENVRWQLMNFKYYEQLSEEGKEKFMHRVLMHYLREYIYGVEGYEPDEKMKIMICATLAQLTFGIDKEWLASFDRIELHPNIFKMRPDGPLMKGATTPNGVVRISVKDYLAGYADATDKLNVGLHEFGHALLIEFTASAEDYNSVKRLVYPYEMEAEKEISKGYDQEHLLRKYAFTNKHEFFAVSVETFFEAPHDLAKEHPQLFAIISHMLNQDPRNTTGDYAIVPPA